MLVKRPFPITFYSFQHNPGLVILPFLALSEVKDARLHYPDSPLSDLLIASVFLLRISNTDNSSYVSKNVQLDHLWPNTTMALSVISHFQCWFCILSFSIISSSVILPPFFFCRSAALEAGSPSEAGSGSITDLVYTWCQGPKKSSETLLGEY